ncbi:MAG: hypothetical protein HY794_15770, partial [Desulfarculus sp.]|nr:hypothetical protein [Desulfarculus sp.]
MVGQITSIWLLSGIAGLFSDKPGGFSLGGLLGGGGGGGVAGALGTGASLVNTAKTVGGWLGIGGAGAGLGGASGFAGPLAAEQSAEMFATMVSNGKTVEEALAAIGGGNGGLLGGIKSAFTSAIETVKGFVTGTEAATAATEAATVATEAGAAATEAASLGLTTSLAWVGGALAVGEILGQLTGGVGPVGAVMELLSGGQGHSKASATRYEQLSVDAIGSMTKGFDPSKDLTGGMATQRTLGDIRQQAEEMRLLGERAGLTAKQIDLLIQGEAGLQRQMEQAAQAGNKELALSLMTQMAELQKLEQQTGINTSALGAMSGAYAQIADVLATKVQPVMDEFGATSQGSIIETDAAVQKLTGEMLDMAAGMGLPRDVAASFKAKMDELVGQWDQGQICLAYDEYPVILQTGEPVFSRRDVARAGGPAAVEAFRRGGGAGVSISIGDVYVSASGLDITRPDQNRKAAAMLARNIKVELAKLEGRKFGAGA